MKYREFWISKAGELVHNIDKAISISFYGAYEKTKDKTNMLDVLHKDSIHVIEFKAYEELRVHGNTYCEHCDDFVLMCSHGLGINYKELCERAEKQNQLMREALENFFMRQDCDWCMNNYKLAKQTLEKLK